MNFCTDCGSKVIEGSKFCGNCGRNLKTTKSKPTTVKGPEKTKKPAVSVEKRANAAMKEAGNPSVSTQQVDEILATHENCFLADLCDVCEYLEDQLNGDLLDALASNPALTPSQQQQVFSFGIAWQGKIVSTIGCFLDNPGIADQIKSDCLSAEDFISYHVGEDLPELMQDYLVQMRENPRFTKKEIKQFEIVCKNLNK